MNGRVSFHFQRIGNQPQSRIELALSGADHPPICGRRPELASFVDRPNSGAETASVGGLFLHLPAINYFRKSEINLAY
jgi:hypothetical protein